MSLQTELVQVPGYEKVVFGADEENGLRAIISIHSTKLGPSCGGIRLLNYKSREEALDDVLRLSKGMSYKSALAKIGFGGGKSVILCDPKKKTPQLFRAFGRFVETLKGKYIAAKDMNVEAHDLMEVLKETEHVLGIEGKQDSLGDPSPVTARGGMAALRAAMEVLNGSSKLKGIKFAIQGLGHVGYGLGQAIHEAGGKIVATDANTAVLEQSKKAWGAEIVETQAIYDVPCDIFSPNAVGGILNEKTIPRLYCKAIVGCANNQLAMAEDGLRLQNKGILYAPDFAVNAGGIINVYAEYKGYDEQKSLQMADQIYDTVKEILMRAKATATPPFQIAEVLAEERLYGRA